MFSCKDIAKKTMSKEPLSWKEKVEYRLHLFICATCKIFVTQMENLDTTMKSVIKNKTQANESEAKNLKEEIIKKAQKKFPSEYE